MPETLNNRLLAIEKRLDDLMASLTCEELISLLSTHQSAITRLNIPEYHIGGEAAHGIVDHDGLAFTVFPQPIGLSQTWHPALLKRVGSAIGVEARSYYQAKNKQTGLSLWAPTIDLERDPRWGRTEEGYGEDPYLTATLGSALIEGMQGDDLLCLQMVAAPKHFYANNNEKERESTSNSVDLRNKYEYYLQPFKAAFTKAKAKSMMTAYNGINGVPAMQHEDINQIVRQQYGMDGYIVSDGGALTLNVTDYQYYATYKEALADSLKKGIDCFVDDKTCVETAAKAALADGLITRRDLSTAIRRTLRVRLLLGQLDQIDPYKSYLDIKTARNNHQSLLHQVTNESIVLLENQNYLPLRNQPTSLLVAGPMSDRVMRDWYTGVIDSPITPLEGISRRFNESDVYTTDGFDTVVIASGNGYIKFMDTTTVTIVAKEEATKWIDEDFGDGVHVLFDQVSKKYLTLNTDAHRFELTTDEVFSWFVNEKLIVNEEQGQQVLSSINHYPLNVEGHQLVETNHQGNCHIETITSGIEEVKKKAQEVDTVVLCVGNHPMINGRETEDRRTLALPHHQQQLIDTTLKHNKQVILIIIASYPYALTFNKYRPQAILYSAHGSEVLGESIAKIMAGDISPTGKLSMTWYQSETDLPPITDYDIIRHNRTYLYFQKAVLYPFGHGLTYYTFTIKHVEVGVDQLLTNGLKVAVSVSNPFNFKVTDVCQVYANTIKSQQKRPNQQLIAFDKVTLKPFEQRVISFEINEEAFHQFDPRCQKMRLISDTIQIELGYSSENIIYRSEPFTLPGSTLAKRLKNHMYFAETFDDYQLAHGDRLHLDQDMLGQTVVKVDSSGAFYFGGVSISPKDTLVLTVQHDCKLQLNLQVNDHSLKRLSSQTIAGYTILFYQGTIEVVDATLTLVTDAPLTLVKWRIDEGGKEL